MKTRKIIFAVQYLKLHCGCFLKTLSVCLCQFSGQSADDMRKTYAEFCSRHIKAVKLYKELLTRDKRFQGFIRVRQKKSLILFVCVLTMNSMNEWKQCNSGIHFLIAQPRVSKIFLNEIRSLSKAVELNRHTMLIS